MRIRARDIIFLISMILHATVPASEGHAGSISKASRDPAPLSRDPTLLTVKTKDDSLREILKTIAKDAGIRLHGAEDVDEVVTVEFYNLPIDEGLRRLLNGRNFAFFYSQETSKKAKFPIWRLRAVQILDGPLKSVGEKIRLATSLSKHQNGEIEIFLSGPVGLEAEKPRLNQGVADALETFGDDEPMKRLARSALENVDPSMREDAAKELGKTWSPEAVEPLAQSLAADQDSFVRRTAAEALGRTWSEAAVDPLAQALMTDPSRYVRENAALALGEIGDAKAIYPLILALYDNDMSVRESAARALGAIGSIKAADALYQSSLNDNDPWVRERAADSLRIIFR